MQEKGNFTVSCNNKSFIIYCDNEVIVGHLPDEEAGILFKSLFPFVRERIKPDFLEEHSALAMAFDIISLSIIRNDEKYAERCKKNRENGKKGGLAKASNRKQSLQNGKRCLANLADSDNDSDSDSDNDGDSDNDRKINYQLIADMYNNTCVSFPRLTKLSDARKKAIKARLNTYTVEDFQKLFELAESSSFLKGQNNRNWSATFDWLIKDTNMAKVLDGNYADNSSSYRNIMQQSQEDDGYKFYEELYKKHYTGETPSDAPFQ